MFNISKSIKRLISASAAAACLVTGVQFTPDAIKITADAASKTGMNASQITQDMKIGWNLGNSLDATGGGAYTGLNTEISWGNPRTTKAMIDTVKAKGFNTIRIPTTWYPHLDGSNNIDSAWMARVKEVVDYCIDNDMYVILNVHHEEWVNVAQFNDQTYQNAETKLKAIWTQVAKEFSSYDQHLVFEGMNEPRQTGNPSVSQWGNGGEDGGYTWNYINKLNTVFVNTVRSQGSSQNKERLLMLPGYCASSDPKAISAIEIPANSGNVALSVHAYAPYFFTMATDQYANHKYPGASGYGEDYTSSLKTMFSNFKQISNQKGAPIVIGEFSASNFNNLNDRIAWAKDYIKLAKECGFPCVLWDNNIEVSDDGEAHGYLNRNAGGTSWYSASEAVVNAYINTVEDPSILWDGKQTTYTTTKYDPTTTTTTTAPVTEMKADFVSMPEEGEDGAMITVAEFAPRGAKSVTLYVKVKSDDTEVSGGFGTWINSTQTWNQEDFEGAPVGADGIAAIDYKLPAVLGNTVKAMVWWPHADDVEIVDIVLHMTDTPGTTTTSKTTTTTTTTKGGNNNTTTTTAAPGNGDVEAEFVKSGQEKGDDGEINNFVEFKPDGAKSVSLYIKVNSNDTEVSGGFGTWINSTSSWEQENFEAVKVGSDKVAIVDYNIPAVVGNTIKAMVWWPHGDDAEILKVVLHKDSAGTTTTSKTTTTTTTTTTKTTTSTTTTSKTTTSTTTTTNTPSKDVKYGDANCDGNVNIGDAVLILQYLANGDKYGVKGSDANHITEQGIKNADCSSVGDGVTPVDALAIQKYLLHIYNDLPV